MNPMKAYQPFIWPSVLLVLFCTALHSREVSVINLKYRPADEIVRIIKPQLGPEESITGKGFVVILSAASDNLPRLEQMIGTLDKPSRQLLITVVQGENARQALASIDVSGNVSIGDNARIEFGRNPQPENTVSVKGESSESKRFAADIQRLRIQEGRSALLYMGQSIPVTAKTIDPRLENSQVVYQQVRTGFWVTARLAGNRYVLDIVSQRESTVSAGSGVVGTQQIQTQVRGQLGKWMDIGEVLGISRHSESGIAYGERQQHNRQQPVYLIIVETTN